jgi:hypothetical protein
MLEAGIRTFFDSETIQAKNPRFDSNSNFDFSVFQEKFDFFLARSIWTHASKPQIETMLDGFQRFAVDTGVFLTSYLKAGRFRHKDYWGSTWVGRSETSDKPGCVYHSFSWLAKACTARGLKIEELKEGIYNHQIWLKITKQRNC